LRKGFLITGTIVTAFGISVLLFYGSVLSVFSGFMAITYPWTLLGLVPGLVIVAIGGWTLFRAKSRIAIPKDLKDMMGPNEKVQLYVKQTNFRPRPFGVKSWLLTNERVIQRQPHSLKLANTYVDRSYAEIRTLHVKQGIFRSTLICGLKGAKEMEADVGVISSEIEKKGSRTKPNKQRSPMTPDEHISELETEVDQPFSLTQLAKLDARKADGIIRENIVRFQTPFFQTPFPSDKIAYDSSQKTV
jgi:hypothetical protein